MSTVTLTNTEEQLTLTLQSAPSILKKVIDIDQEYRLWDDPLSQRIHHLCEKAKEVEVSELPLEELQRQIDHIRQKVLVNSLDEQPLLDPYLLCNRYVVEGFVYDEWKTYLGMCPIEGEELTEITTHTFALAILEVIKPYCTKIPPNPNALKPLPENPSEEQLNARLVTYGLLANASYEAVRNKETAQHLNTMNALHQKNIEMMREALEKKAKEFEEEQKKLNEMTDERLNSIASKHHATQEITKTQMKTLTSKNEELSETVTTQSAEIETQKKKVDELAQALEQTKKDLANAQASASKGGGGFRCTIL